MTRYGNEQDFNSNLFEFLSNSPTAFHVTANVKSILQSAGYTELDEKSRWKVQPGKGYFVEREESALVAFTLGTSQKLSDGFRMIASHADSPGLQVKPCADVHSPPYLQLGVEVYGGPLLHQWFDRDLSLAGRVSCKISDTRCQEYLIDFGRPLLTIPSIAIHLDREANNAKPIDKQKLLPPVISQSFDDQITDFQAILLEQIKRQYPDEDIISILGHDLYCYDCQPPSCLGAGNEFIAAGRLDNQLSCHASATALAESLGIQNSMIICSNHEENGSTSTTGAQGSLLSDILERLLPAPEDRQICLRNSFLISADNAHAVHPNYKEKSDPGHTVSLNEGIVIKINANQRYATNSRTAARFKMIADKAGVAVQEFVMRSDMPCGSTVGPLTAAKLGIETIDIGAPTFGMHSIRELTGRKDAYALYRLLSYWLQEK